jgi:hypothetical protein
MGEEVEIEAEKETVGLPRFVYIHSIRAACLFFDIAELLSGDSVMRVCEQRGSIYHQRALPNPNG